MLSNQTVIRLLCDSGASGHERGALQVDPEKLSGLGRWLAESYNDHRMAFAFGTVAALLVSGVVIGLLTEVILTRLGLGAKAIENHE